MEPNVIRLYSSSPPPLDEVGEEEEEDEFGDFGGFHGGGVSSSFSFSEIDTPTTFVQSKALEDSPPDLCIKSVLNHPAPGSEGWENEGKADCQSIGSFEIIEESPTNGRTTTDFQKSLLKVPDIQNRCLGDEQSTCNGYSEPCPSSDQDPVSVCLPNMEAEEHAELDHRVDPCQSCDHMPDLNDYSFHLETSEPGETEVRLEILPCSLTARKVEGEQEQTGDADCLNMSVDSMDKANGEGVPSTEEIISATQLSGDKGEINGPSTNAVGGDIETATDLTAHESFCDFRETTQGFADFSQAETVTQEDFPEFVTAMSRCSTDDEFGDEDTLKEFKEEDDLEKVGVDEGAFCSMLPPSDSFADFSAAPFGGATAAEDDNWAAFGTNEVPEADDESWATFEEEKSICSSKEQQDVEASTAPSSEDLQGCTVDLSCRIQQLFRSTFPLDIPPDASEILEVLPLHTFLLAQDPPELRITRSCTVHENPLEMWRHLQDILGTHGLKYKWAGSHSNKILLNCLGIRNILFTGDKKQPLIVPMFAAGLGMLEPTKEPVKTPASPALTPSAPVAPSMAITIDAQGAGSSGLDLDYFGPVDDCSSDSDTDPPLPGVDPEIYELSTAKMENNATGRNIADAFSKLMESFDKTKTSARKPERDEEISEEALKVITLLPDLSFMQARVLMFPSILTPAANHK
ncbi:hypothetical protein DNTS_035378 [Danionella cerebrum]|uniref:Aftiphilin clathrin-binding box domain-containing protein n=1 Tax=Danionella cerebrum TaxID=2873325 RepID=A0A553Q1J4_9TELE|nr:hypothetical protein DNTS_035378 [Danionella translucida]